jgi:hypothetical protein
MKNILAPIILLVAAGRAGAAPVAATAAQLDCDGQALRNICPAFVTAAALTAQAAR